MFEEELADSLPPGDVFELIGAGYWPHQTGPWADVLNPMPKYVASRTLRGSLVFWVHPSIGGASAHP